ncbi:hypothetical protein LCGC14_2772890 [marine sediment metagenome]|uniref:Uncharacterized protein n=1 Tax=marine sediment metagenome TaxID=412755 RepID=A0A0F9BM83_9ZZZZ
MKDIEELNNMTWWDITTNEGAFTNFALGSFMLFLSVMYAVLAVYYKIKLAIKR